MWAVLSRLVSNCRPHRAPAGGFRPRLEALEARDCPRGGSLEWADPTGNGAADVAVQPDGKIVSVGHIHTDKIYSAIEVLRFNTDGTPDTSFNGTGAVTINFGEWTEGTAVAIQPDGKILAGGRGPTRQDGMEYVVARLNPNGSLDTTFGNTGKRGVGGGIWAYNASSTSAEWLKDLAMETDASNHLTGIMIGGSLGGAFEAIKLTPAGVLDTTWGGGDGDAIFSVGAIQGASGMALTPSGGVVMVGTGKGPNGVILALNAAGELDTNFNGTGYRVDNFATPPLPNEVPATYFDAVTVQPTTDGYRVIVSGFVYIAGAPQNEHAGLLVAYTSNGQLDPTFANGGVMTTAAAAEFYKVALERDGSIIALGYSYFTNPDGSSGIQGTVGHLFADGSVDTSFGTAGNGFSLLPEFDGPQGAMGLAIDPQGFIDVAYTSGDQTYVARLTGP